ncbi:hypothetical protein OIDMADRAFT_53931 [Oidiodendron maius Zn]|uniref:Uncharacterized protein n=1 Tax=Oidiodendron maius (strain Zn) TaxID=913774 RepID=A0A0C3H2M3_OIDMZ|nr:hypothetical protein OIDMADRAFT_53931 [Oidiodendron maius Zn]
MKSSTISTPFCWLNKPRKCSKYTQKIRFDVPNLWTYNPYQPEFGENPIGIPIHSCCWDILERHIGPCRGSHDLERLVHVLHKRWTGAYFFGLGNSIKIKNNRKVWDAVLQSFYEDGYQGYSVCDSDPVATLTNPTNREMFEHFTPRIKEFARKKRLRTLRSWRFYNNSVAISSHLPLEIVYNILDYIHGTDTLLALEMLEWQVPDSYWRRRIPQDVLSDLDIDLEELNAIADIDWPFLCLKAEELLDTSPSFLNRQRILRIVESVKRLVE